MPICFKLLMHWDRRAASRAACTAGSSSAIRTAMIAMTTSSSIRVKAREDRETMRHLDRLVGTGKWEGDEPSLIRLGEINPSLEETGLRTWTCGPLCLVER